VVLDSPYAIGIIFVTLALMWVLQMYLAKKQATSFLNAVNSIKGSDLEVAIGVNQPKWGRKKIYIAVSANAESIIVDGLTLEGVTTFAKSKKLTLFNGMSLHEIVTSDKNEPIWEAASMASDTLIKRIESKKDSNSIS
jgi:DNA-binding transcriptional regulator of glucitol operon|tara:strand:- start:162 stop:575 length:414 start_codon:yes stop_codon:yes gene_type:complete